jgi:hypothetical protein
MTGRIPTAPRLFEDDDIASSGEEGYIASKWSASEKRPYVPEYAVAKPPVDIGAVPRTPVLRRPRSTAYSSDPDEDDEDDEGATEWTSFLGTM